MRGKTYAAIHVMNIAMYWLENPYTDWYSPLSCSPRVRTSTVRTMRSEPQLAIPPSRSTVPKPSSSRDSERAARTASSRQRRSR